MIIAMQSKLGEGRETMGASPGQQDAGGSAPATDKQKTYMQGLGTAYPADVTKQEASMRIDERLGKNGK